MDFTDPVIRGLSLFHCHLLNQEDKGMIAKVLSELGSSLATDSI
jgi:FtsP/CotA-like multicopper oxidase with cupredoxin domain